MWKSSNTETVKAPAKAVWQAWTNVAGWPQQDQSITSASINGPFVVGSKITIKPKGSPTVKVTLKKVAVNRVFASQGSLPLAKLEFIHQIETVDGKTQFTQSVVISGPLSGLFAKLMGPSMAKNLKARMKKMVELLEAAKVNHG